MGNLKDVEDFSLNKIVVKKDYEISLRFNDFENAFKAFKCLSTGGTNKLSVSIKVKFENPTPTFYDGRMATVFENCIKEKFEGLNEINEIDSDYVKNSLKEL